MVGGIVIEAVWEEDSVFVDCRSTRYRDTCGIRVVRNADSEQIELGDKFWWQAGKAFWTPAGESRVDVQIPRSGQGGTTLDRRYANVRE